MYGKLMIFFLLLETLHITYATTPSSNKLIQNICETLHNNNSLQHDEDRQWEIICQELFHSKDDDQYPAEQPHVMDEQNISQNKRIHKAAIRVGGGIRGGTIRGGTIRGGGSSGGSSGIRQPSGTQYRNTRTGTRIDRPNGWLWSRSSLIFLPIALRFGHRYRSSSSRFTTPSTGLTTYYYCTSLDDPSTEIQCSSVDGDDKCCEDEDTQQAFCCGGNIPDYILQDMNRATQTIARIFSTLAVLALCMHLFMRRFYRE